jgi:hypothetical protein
MQRGNKPEARRNLIMIKIRVTPMKHNSGKGRGELVEKGYFADKCKVGVLQAYNQLWMY